MFGLECQGVPAREARDRTQTFINMVPFTAPMMYPYHVVADVSM